MLRRSFSLIARHLEVHIIQKNSLINLSIHKGCMPNLRQCWDGISLVWHELRAEKSNIISTAAIWLDIENTHGSIPHQYIYHTRKH